MIESFKHSFGDVSQLGDPKFFNRSAEKVQILKSKDYSSLIRRKISLVIESILSLLFILIYFKMKKKKQSQTFDILHYGGEEMTDRGSNSVVVVDTERNAVALTSSLNGPFGSCVYSNSTGILLNNQMGSFNILPPTNVTLFRNLGNKIEPGKRPISSISCTILLRDGNVQLAVASSGGSFSGQTMVTSVVQVKRKLINFLNLFFL